MNMTYKLSIDKKPNYLHAIVTGQNNRENVEQYLGEILLECKKVNCFRVLIEECLDGIRLKTLDVFQIASEGSKQSIGIFQKVAYVDINAEDDLMQFAQNVTVNRGFPVSVFSNVAEAEKWLLAENH